MAHNVVSFEKWHSTFAEKHIKAFFQRSYNKTSSSPLWEKMCRLGIRRTKTFQASLGKFGQKSFASPNVCLFLRLSVTHKQADITTCTRR